MRKVLKRNGCKSASHQFFKDRAKNRVDDLQMMFSDLQSARKESRTVEATVLEEQVYQMLREWKAELNEPSPASSLQNDSLGTFSTDIYRLLHLCDEEDDATSPFELSAPKPEPDIQNFQSGRAIVIQEGLDVKHGPEEQNRSAVDQCKESPGFQSLVTTNMDMATTQLDYNQFNLHLDLEHHYLNGYLGIGVDTTNPISGFLPIICPPPSAFLGPKCALWDCPRPAQGADWWLDYCSSFHATLALNEGPPGMTPVLRPGGIGLKDGLLFAALSAKVQGKDVGIPECEGAATTKSPWNAPELFDLSVLEGETIREWLFFDKPRRAFESGNRKQRSLPDYSGRGWHESRKQVMNEFNGLKRSYYMDPQPLNIYEWHLYEYEINKCDACALYRLELKLVDGKKTPRGKTAHDSLSELQKKMGRLTAEFPLDNKRPLKGGAKINGKDGIGNLSVPNRSVGPDETFEFGASAPYGYLVDNINGYYLK
ncbi:transcription factor VOZ1 [Silene latifolia]|uniref:transcription factor VOZ1 n=1 Tax=Silene latifolia TaxID=37657 RepID=UPI003D77DBDC